MDNLCLNCSEPIAKIFCANCGQKAVHRITLWHFITHDVLHGVWHFEKGILFTVKEALVRPGQAALDYIGGKRIRYYNIFYLCLLVIALHVVLVHAYDVIHPERLKKVDNDLRIMDFFSKYLKIILLGFVPFVALNARLIFRRLKLNLAEHFILSGINLLGMLVIALFYMFLQFVNEYQMPVWVVWFQLIAFFLILIYPAWTYYGATKKTYRFLGFIWRITVFYLLILLQLSLILYWIYFEITNNSDITFRL